MTMMNNKKNNKIKMMKQMIKKTKRIKIKMVLQVMILIEYEKGVNIEKFVMYYKR